MTDKVHLLFHSTITTRSFMILEVIKDNMFVIASFITRGELD